MEGEGVVVAVILLVALRRNHGSTTLWDAAASLAGPASARTSLGIPAEVLVAGGILLCAASWAFIPGWWRGGEAASAFPDDVNRAYLAIVCFLSGLTLIVSIGVAQDHGAIGASMSRALGLPVAAITVVSGIAAATISLLNWPKFLVPPALRAQPGGLRRRGTR
jgi:UDP-N-acetylmuramyl pentapeptide phosphotransferase/UDP-N-acetylglucosamine-1-phosphate transferase